MNGFFKFVVTFLFTQGIVNGLPQYNGYPYYPYRQYGAQNYNNNPYENFYNNGGYPSFGGIAGPRYASEPSINIYATNNGGIDNFALNGGKINSYNPNVRSGINSVASLSGPNGYSNGGNVQRVKNVASNGGKINNLNQNINNESNILGNANYNSINNCVGCTKSTENVKQNVTNNKKLNNTNTNNVSVKNKNNYGSK